MRLGIGGLIGVAAAVALLGSQGFADAPPPRAASPAIVSDPGEVSVLSYNVEGLPWPVASGRAEAADAIADRLATLRLTGAQPHIVAIQEAFDDSAKQIGRRAGYRFSALGPSETDIGAPARSDRDRLFATAASPWIGETLGRHADSGLALFSDYPILWAARVAFPAYACAGLDCLANKGMLAVALQIPGASRSLIVIDTHLNSRSASLAPDARSNYAFGRQVDALRGLVDRLKPAGDIVLAGDFNVGGAKPRSMLLGDRLFRGEGFALAESEHDNGRHQRSIGSAGRITEPALERTKTLMAFEGGLRPMGAVGTFGTRADGTMLSDHIGIEHRFRVGI